MQKSSKVSSPLAQLVAKALEFGAHELEVEYKDGYEEVCVMNGNLGFGIARFEASSKDGRGLREHLWAISKKSERLDVLGTTYRVKVKRFDSFGEVAFRVTFGAA